MPVGWHGLFASLLEFPFALRNSLMVLENRHLPGCRIFFVITEDSGQMKCNKIIFLILRYPHQKTGLRYYSLNREGIATRINSLERESLLRQLQCSG